MPLLNQRKRRICLHLFKFFLDHDPFDDDGLLETLNSDDDYDDED